MCSPHLQSAIHNLKSKIHRGHSSVGRAPALQAGSQGFESPCLQNLKIVSAIGVSPEKFSSKKSPKAKFGSEKIVSASCRNQQAGSQRSPKRSVSIRVIRGPLPEKKMPDTNVRLASGI